MEKGLSHDMAETSRLTTYTKIKCCAVVRAVTVSIANRGIENELSAKDEETIRSRVVGKKQERKRRDRHEKEGVHFKVQRR